MEDDSRLDRARLRGRLCLVFFTSQDSIRALYDQQITEGKVEDGELTTMSPLSDETVRKLEEEGVTLYENFNLELSETKQKQLKAFKNRTDINIAQILEGRLPENDHEVALSGNYARANKIMLSDTIKLEGKTFDIVGIISLPDYSSILRNRSDLLMDTGYFGTCLLHEDGFDGFRNLPVKYTYSYHTKTTLDKKAATDKLRALVEIVNEGNRVLDGVTRYDNHCITYIMDDMGGDIPTMTVSMVILFIALAFISAVQVKSMIEKEAPVIGTLLASGYTKRELVANYMATPVLLTVIASVIGNVLAYTYFYKGYADLYYGSFDLPAFQPILNARSFLITSVFPFVIYLVINFFVISKALGHRPIQFLRNNLRKEKKNRASSFTDSRFCKIPSPHRPRKQAQSRRTHLRRLPRQSHPHLRTRRETRLHDLCRQDERHDQIRACLFRENGRTESRCGESDHPQNRTHR